jgi:hypothetical protein
VIQGWKDGPVLQDGQAPPPAQPADYPNRGNAAAANESGVAEWVWGGGEGFDPAKTEGAHWYWCSVPGCYSDVVCGFGWRWGTEHWKLEPVFERVEPGEVPPPDEGDLAEAVRDVAAAIRELAEAVGPSVKTELIHWRIPRELVINAGAGDVSATA